MSISRLRPLTAVTCLASAFAFACADEKVTGFSSQDKEFFNQDAPFQRGTKILGDPCSATRECDSLYCLDGACAQPCAAVACPLGAACSLELVSLQVACNDEAEVDTCAQIDSCLDGLCGCIDGDCVQATEYLCRELCPEGLCGDNATCDTDRVLGVDVCFPGGAQPPPPGAAVGEPCPNGDECDAGLVCDTSIYSVGFCTRDCTNDGQCPDGSHCVNYGQDLDLCLDDCGADSTCSIAEAMCADVGGGTFVCF